jgi:ketosteroid isomerase-like protein
VLALDDTELHERLAGVERQLRLLEDREAIRRLICSWGPACDVGDSEAAAALWTDDGVLVSDMSRLEGPLGVRAMVESDGQQALIARGCAHIQGLPVITVTADEAVATNYSTVFLHTDDGGYETWRVSGNHWEFRRTREGWRVTRRTAYVINGGPEAKDLLARALDEVAS